MPGNRRADLARRHEPLVGVRRRHPDVDDRDRRLVHRDVTQQVVGVVGLGHDLEARLGEQPRDALAQQDRVLGDHDRHRVPEQGDRVAQRREVARETVREQLVDVLGLRQARRAGGCRGRERRSRPARTRSPRGGSAHRGRPTRCAPRGGRRCPCSRLR